MQRNDATGARPGHTSGAHPGANPHENNVVERCVPRCCHLPHNYYYMRVPCFRGTMVFRLGLFIYWSLRIWGVPVNWGTPGLWVIPRRFGLPASVHRIQLLGGSVRTGSAQPSDHPCSLPCSVVNLLPLFTHRRLELAGFLLQSLELRARAKRHRLLDNLFRHGGQAARKARGEPGKCNKKLGAGRAPITSRKMLPRNWSLKL